MNKELRTKVIELTAQIEGLVKQRTVLLDQPCERCNGYGFLAGKELWHPCSSCETTGKTVGYLAGFTPRKREPCFTPTDKAHDDYRHIWDKE